MKHFRKLKIASAVSLAIFAVQAPAVVQIKDNVQLTDENYSEALQWTPGAEDNTLELNNVTVDTDVKGHAGVLVYTANKNNISVNDSNIKGGDTGYALRFASVTDSNILIDKTDLSTSGGNAYTYKSDLLSGSNLTFKDSTLTGGQRGISITNAENSSVITLDNTKIKEVSGFGVRISSLTDSALNILNGSEINGPETAADTTGLGVTATGSQINVDKSAISGGILGILTTLNSGSSLNVTDSVISGENDKGIKTTLNDHSSLNISGSTLSGKNNGLNAVVNDSSVVIDNASFTGIYGINFTGQDSNIALSNSQT
ncbi:hypothetical protein ACISK3_09895 [Morganella morganii]|nr:hypothetical protein [Morganella morganii]